MIYSVKMIKSVMKYVLINAGMREDRCMGPSDKRGRVIREHIYSILKKS